MKFQRIMWLMGLIMLTMLFWSSATISHAQDSFIRAADPGGASCDPFGWVFSFDVTFFKQPNEQIRFSWTEPVVGGSANASSSLNIQTSPVSNWGVGRIIQGAPASLPYTVDVTYYIRKGAEIVDSTTMRLTCSSTGQATVQLSGDGLFPVAPDHRANFQHCDIYSVFYQTSGENDLQALHIYSVDQETGNGSFLMEITADEFTPPVETNTLIKTVGNVSAYILTSGELQFNIGPDFEGKTCVVIADGLSVGNVHSFTIGP